MDHGADVRAGERTRIPTRAAWRALPIGLVISLCGCPSHDRDYDLLSPSDVPKGRPSGCVDTPFLGPDQQNASRGIDCTPRTSRTHVTMLRGKVVAEALAGLPGAGLEAMLVSVHRIDGAPALDHLPKPLAEVTTDAQGSFVISVVLGAGSYYVAVRASADQAAVAIQQITVAERDSTTALLLRVPIDPELREQAEAEAHTEAHGDSTPEPAAKVEPQPRPEGPAPPPPVLPRPTPR